MMQNSTGGSSSITEGKRIGASGSVAAQQAAPLKVSAPAVGPCCKSTGGSSSTKAQQAAPLKASAPAVGPAAPSWKEPNGTNCTACCPLACSGNFRCTLSAPAHASARAIRLRSTLCRSCTQQVSTKAFVYARHRKALAFVYAGHRKALAFLYARPVMLGVYGQCQCRSS